MHGLLLVISIGSFFGAFIVFMQSMNNAFKKKLIWGLIILLFPIGTYFYYKKFFAEEKSNIMKFIIFLATGILFLIISKF
jgi:hypothetical protein